MARGAKSLLNSKISALRETTPSRSSSLPLDAMKNSPKSSSFSTLPLYTGAPRADSLPIETHSMDSNETAPSYTTQESIPNGQVENQRSSIVLSDHPEEGEVSDDDDDDNEGDSASDSDESIIYQPSEKRHQEFRAHFKSIPEDEKLIRVFGCALQKEILVQGRLFLSEHHISFYANVIGWVTNIVVAFSEITAIEKKLTAFVIPNAISVMTTSNTKGYFFTSFLSRDSAYGLMMTMWRRSFPCPANAIVAEDQGLYPRYSGSPTTLPDEDDTKSLSGRKWGRNRHNSIGSREDLDDAPDIDTRSTHSKRPKRHSVRKIFKSIGKHDHDHVPSLSEPSLPPTSFDDRKQESPETVSTMGDKSVDIQTSAKGGHSPTVCQCSKDGRHYPSTYLTETYPGSVEKMWKLLFESDFNKSFLSSEVMKGADIQEEAWKISPSGKPTRITKYIKWLGLPIGPKTTKATLTDTCDHKDFDDYVTNVTSTSTPDVPSGGNFTTNVRTCITWAGPNQVKVVVTGGCVFTKSSWIKGQIEKGANDGLTTHYKEMNKSIRKYISEHPAEFDVGTASSTAQAQGRAQSDTSNTNDASNTNVASDKTALESNSSSSTIEQSTSTKGNGILSTITSKLSNSDDLSTYALVGVLLFIVLANIHIWRQISGVTSQIEKVHADVIAGHKQHQEYHRAITNIKANLHEGNIPTAENDKSNNIGQEVSQLNVDLLGTEARLQDKIDDLRRQLEALESSLELGSQGL